MKTKLVAVITALVIIAALTLFIINTPRHNEIKPEPVSLLPEKQQIGPTTSKYELPASEYKTEDVMALSFENKPSTPTETSDSSNKTEKLIAEEETASAEENVSQEETAKPRKYPDAEKMRQMQEKGIVLY